MAKGSGSRPVERIKLKRKDGEAAEGQNRDGTPYKATHVEFGAVFENDRGKSVAISPGFAITYKGKVVADSTKDSPSYVNVFDAAGGRREEPEAEDEDEDEDF
jgi:hypothetical protein